MSHIVKKNHSKKSGRICLEVNHTRGSDGREFIIAEDRILKEIKSLKELARFRRSAFIPGSMHGGDKRADTCIVVWIR